MDKKLENEIREFVAKFRKQGATIRGATDWQLNNNSGFTGPNGDGTPTTEEDIFEEIAVKILILWENRNNVEPNGVV